MGEGLATVSVQGRVNADGTFEWGTEQLGDGAKPGSYRVAVIPRGLADAEIAQGVLPDVDPKLSDPDRSGLTFEVKEGRNTFDIKVSKPKRRGK
jgi:hypothetical protein